MLNLPNPSNYKVGYIHEAKAKISVQELLTASGLTLAALKPIEVMFKYASSVLQKTLTVSSTNPYLFAGIVIIAISETVVDKLLENYKVDSVANISIYFECTERTAYKNGQKYTFKQWEYSYFKVV